MGTDTRKPTAQKHSMSLQFSPDLAEYGQQKGESFINMPQGGGLTNLKPFLAVADCLRCATTRARGFPLQLEPVSTFKFMLLCCADAPEADDQVCVTDVFLIRMRYLAFYCARPGGDIHGPCVWHEEE